MQMKGPIGKLGIEQFLIEYDSSNISNWNDISFYSWNNINF